MLKEARQVIESGLRESQFPVCMWSSGIDSMLLLFLLRKYVDIPVLWFHEDLSTKQAKFAHSIIRDWQLTVFNYAPMDRYYLPNEKGLTLINEYSIGGAPFPVLTDVEHSEQCGLDISKQRTPYFAYHWPVTFVGWKETDGHFITGKNPFPPDGTQVGNTRFFAPLRHMTDADVLRLTKRLGIPMNQGKYAGNTEYDPDYLHRCTRCFSKESEVFCPKQQAMIPTQPWERDIALSNFRTRFLAH